MIKVNYLQTCSQLIQYLFEHVLFKIQKKKKKMRTKKQNISQELENSPSLHSLSVIAEKELNGYLANFINETSSLSNREKMAQIGIEPSTLGIPSEGPSFDKCRSLFGDEPFDYWTSAKVPSSYVELNPLESPLTIVPKVPDLTLFFMFYAQPKDEVQITACQELKNREWKYVKKDKKMVWYKEKGDTVYYFNINNWAIIEKPKKQKTQ